MTGQWVTQRANGSQDICRPNTDSIHLILLLLPAHNFLPCTYSVAKECEHTRAWYGQIGDCMESNISI